MLIVSSDILTTHKRYFMANQFRRNLSADYSIKPKSEAETPSVTPVVRPNLSSTVRPEPKIEPKPEVKTETAEIKPMVKTEQPRVLSRPTLSKTPSFTLSQSPTTNLSKTPTINKTPIRDVKDSVVVTAREEVKPKKKKSLLWLRIILLILLALVFLSACAFTGYYVYKMINKKDMTSVYTSLSFNHSDTISISVNECIYEFEDDTTYTTQPVSDKDLSFKWKNQSQKIYEIDITFDKTQALRFRQYNLYNGTYTHENLFNIDFESLTPNFSSKFILKEDGYYYFDMNSQSSNTYTLVVIVDFDVPDYHDQFNGNDIDEIFCFEQSSDPNSDWGYYQYMSNK